MEPLLEMFPLLQTKEMLASPEELAPFQNYSSRMAAIDDTVCLHSEVFVTTRGGNFPQFLLGHRRYLYGGHSRTIRQGTNLLLQLPQIVLNTRNMLAGNKSALLAVPWLGMLTGLLGNLCLVSYFIKMRETEAVVVQTLGVISTYVVMLQLAMGEAMPLPHFVATSIVLASGLILNCLKYTSI